MKFHGIGDNFHFRSEWIWIEQGKSLKTNLGNNNRMYSRDHRNLVFKTFFIFTRCCYEICHEGERGGLGIYYSNIEFGIVTKIVACCIWYKKSSAKSANLVQRHGYSRSWMFIRYVRKRLDIFDFCDECVHCFVWVILKKVVRVLNFISSQDKKAHIRREKLVINRLKRVSMINFIT